MNAVDLDGKKQKDIANEMGLPYSTLKTHVQNAREKLKQMFLECCDLELDRRGNVIDSECLKKTTENVEKECTGC